MVRPEELAALRNIAARRKLAESYEPSGGQKLVAGLGDAISQAYGGKGGMLPLLLSQSEGKRKEMLSALSDERRAQLDEYLMGKRQAFESGEAEKGRGFRSEEAAKARGFEAGEAKKVRDWKDVQAEADRRWRKEIEELKIDAEKGTKGQPKASQYQVGNFGGRMLQAEKIFNDLEAQGYNRAGVGRAVGTGLQRVAGLGTKKFTSAETLQQEQAERNFVNAVLRRESGAAIAPSEFESAALQYFPRVGDDPQTIENKKANRKQAIRSFLAEAGDQVVNEVVNPSELQFWESAKVLDQHAGKEVDQKGYNPKTNQTQIVYKDGSKVTVNGRF